MEATRRQDVCGPIRLLFEGSAVGGLSDGQLLDRFLDRRAGGDREAAELAFGALVERHGTAVLRTCRTRLGHEHDAQDACQATFLILARKARSIRRQESLASWLDGVARRVASCARRSAALRRAREREVVETRPTFAVALESSDLSPVVWEEVGGLPEHERAPLTFCLLDGLTHEEAATRWAGRSAPSRPASAEARTGSAPA